MGGPADTEIPSAAAHLEARVTSNDWRSKFFRRLPAKKHKKSSGPGSQLEQKECGLRNPLLRRWQGNA